MDINDFSSRFDVLLNSYSDGSIVLDEYEKSVFLTKSQWALLQNLYSGDGIKSFESNEEVRRYLSNLVKQHKYTLIEPELGQEPDFGISDRIYEVTLPDDLGFITLEIAQFSDEVSCNKKRRVNVQPVTQDEYNIIRKNPFRGANDNRVLRLDIEDKVQLISKYPLTKYIIRYIKKPKPIILTLLPPNLNIEGETEPRNSEVSSLLHESILEYAVNLAIATRGTGTKTKKES